MTANRLLSRSFSFSSIRRQSSLSPRGKAKGAEISKIMLVWLGSRPDFVAEVGEIGLESLILAVVPVALSVAVVYPLSRRFLQKRDQPW